MEGEGKAVVSRVPPFLRAYGSLRTEATGCDQEAEAPTYEWLDIDDDGSHRKRRSTLRRAAGILGVAVFLGVALSATNVRWTMSQDVKSMKDELPTGNTMFQALRTSPLLSLGAENEYGGGDHRAWALYGYDMVVEPFRTTILRVHRQYAATPLHTRTANFHWLLVPSDRFGNQLEDAEPVIDSLGGSHATVELTKPGEYFSLVVREMSEDGYTLAEAKATVACKYVRRELRDLTDSDREAFLEALRIYYMIGAEDGVEKYGPAFTNFERVVALHNSDAFCYHNGMHFLTAHAAFNLLVERALQLINPRVSLASWDFMIEAAELGTGWPESEVFGPHMFGSAIGTPENDYQISDGVFANVSSVLDVNNDKFDPVIEVNHNPYGYVTASYNYQDLPGISRTHSFCGMRGEAEFAQCEVLIGCFTDNDNLYDWAVCLEKEVHASMHGMLGGGFNCNTDLEQFLEEHPDYSRGLLTFVFEFILANKWPSNSLCRNVNSCDTNCTVGQTEPCGCTSSLDPFEMDDDDVYGFVIPVMKHLRNRFGGSEYVYEDETRSHPLYFVQDGVPLADEDSYFLMRMIITIGCEPGSVGAMSAGNSPNDPIFWVIHPIMEKALHALELAPGLREGYTFEWVNGTCDGSRIYDEVPFSEKMLGLGESTDFLINAELLELIHPAKGLLPYIYTSFGTWGVCTDWDPCPECVAGSKVSEDLEVEPIKAAVLSALDLDPAAEFEFGLR